MENTLFGSGSTKLTSGVVSEGFNLDTGLYEAMYESSQMELKILEAMIKADSLSRKYQAQGIYSESAIQAFNEEAKGKIGEAIKNWISSIGEKIREWWSTFKTKAIDILGTIREKLIKALNYIKSKFANKKSKDKNTPTKALPAASGSPVQKALTAPAASDNAIPLGPSSKPNYDNIEVDWPNKIIDWEDKMKDILVDVIDQIQNVRGLVQKAGSSMNEKTVNAFKDVDRKTQDIASKVQSRANVAHNVNPLKTTRKRVGDIPEIKSDPINSVIKMVNDKIAEINRCDKIIAAMTKGFNDIGKEISAAGNPGITAVLRSSLGKLQQATMSVLNSFRAFAQNEMQCLSQVGHAIATAPLGEAVASLVGEAAVYELFVSKTVENNYDLYSAEDIKKFAAARLEAAMDEISDVIDSAIGSDHAQGIENINRASTNVLDPDVSNDPNKLTYDDDCYSQDYDFGDENIAGTVDANIVGTSTNVASGNETKAAIESFFFNF